MYGMFEGFGKGKGPIQGPVQDRFFRLRLDLERLEDRGAVLLGEATSALILRGVGRVQFSLLFTRFEGVFLEDLSATRTSSGIRSRWAQVLLLKGVD